MRGRRPRPLWTRFWEKIELPEDLVAGCWIWRGSSAGGNRKGDTGGPYPVFFLRASPGAPTRPHHGARPKRIYAHRLMVWLCTGSDPGKRVPDHRCGVRLCVNPRHLEVVTQKVNGQRAADKAARTMGRGKYRDPFDVPAENVL